MSDRRTLSSREVQVDTDVADLTYMVHQSTPISIQKMALRRTLALARI